MKTVCFLYCVGLVLGGCGIVNAHNFDVSLFPDSPLHSDPFPVQEEDPSFTANKDGISISAHLSSSAKDLDSLYITLSFRNQSSSKLIVHDFGTSLYGLDFQLTDANGRDVEAAPRFKAFREAGRKDSLIIGYQAITLDPGDA